MTLVTSPPKITIITPSYNQAEFLERTIISIISQDYANLEYIVIDGGSNDGSLEIIKKYSKYIAYWESAPDGGQANAINKALKIATGDWVCWQNSDDIFYPNTFNSIANVITSHDIDFIIGDINIIDRYDVIIKPQRYVKPSYKSILSEGMMLTNQAAFWKREIHKNIGLLDEGLNYAFDYDWFLRLLNNYRKVYHLPKIIGALRHHDSTKTNLNQLSFNAEMKEVRSRHGSILLPKFFYTLRRIILIILNGNPNYIYKGICRKMLKIKVFH